MPSLLVVHEVAQAFGVSRNTVFDWIRSGRLPHIRTPGRGIRVKRDVVLQILGELKS
jgi:excisionase family DNA binding protein